jgi:hypothetical protein
VDHYRRDTQPPTGTRDSGCNFSPVGNEDTTKQK